MKKLYILITFGITFIANSYGQHYFSCEYTNICTWNSKTKKFDICEGTEESSLFKINKEETVITLNCESGKYSYFINSSENKDENKSIMYATTCNNGKEYIINVDLTNDEIHILQVKTEYITPMKAYFIKKIWSDE